MVLDNDKREKRKADEKKSQSGSRSGEMNESSRSGDMNESSPNPHNEAHVTEIPVRTDHSQTTGSENVAQTSNMRDGRLNPSVAEGVAEPNVRLDDDSMFNEADPQAAAIRRRNVKEKDHDHRRENDKPRKTA
jgi:hypothetical protein